MRNRGAAVLFYDMFHRKAKIHPAEKQSGSRKTFQTSRWCCHDKVNKAISSVSQCADPEIINQSKTIASPQQCPGFYRAASAEGPLSCTLLMGLKLNVSLFRHRWTPGVCRLHAEGSIECCGAGRAPRCVTHPYPIMQQAIHPSH